MTLLCGQEADMAVRKRERGVGGGLCPSMTDDVKAGSDIEHHLLILHMIQVNEPGGWSKALIGSSTVHLEPWHSGTQIDLHMWTDVAW